MVPVGEEKEDLMKNPTPDFAEYEAVIKKVADFSDAVSREHQDEIHCQKGCSQCCVSGLTVLPVEAAYVRAALNKSNRPLPARPLSPSHCTFLDPHGVCTIYDQRPLLCRTHGLPLKVLPEEAQTASSSPSLRVLNAETITCSLNFEAGAPPPAKHILDVQHLQRLLWVVNTRYCQTQAHMSATDRIPMEAIATPLEKP